MTRPVWSGGAGAPVFIPRSLGSPHRSRNGRLFTTPGRSPTDRPTAVRHSQTRLWGSAPTAVIQNVKHGSEPSSSGESRGAENRQPSQTLGLESNTESWGGAGRTAMGGWRTGLTGQTEGGPRTGWRAIMSTSRAADGVMG